MITKVVVVLKVVVGKYIPYLIAGASVLAAALSNAPEHQWLDIAREVLNIMALNF